MRTTVICVTVAIGFLPLGDVRRRGGDHAARAQRRPPPRRPAPLAPLGATNGSERIV